MKTCGSCVYWVTTGVGPIPPGIGLCFGAPPYVQVSSKGPAIITPNAKPEFGVMLVRPPLPAEERACGAHKAQPANGEPDSTGQGQTARE